MQVNMTVNGEQVTADVEPRMLLVHFLRDQLRLTGTHWGCDTSNCGTCEPSTMNSSPTMKVDRRGCRTLIDL